MTNRKYYFLQGNNVRWTIWLDREEDWDRANAGNYYPSRWAAESAKAMRKTIIRIFMRKSNVNHLDVAQLGGNMNKNGSEE